MTKVHITLSKDAARSPERVRRLRDLVQELAGLTNVNERRLARYGVLTGEVRAECVARLRGLPGEQADVQAVDVDELKRAL